MDSWFLAAIHGSQGNQKMVADDPLRKLCLGKLRNIPVQLLSIGMVILQAVLFNYNLAKSLEDNLQYLWFIGDGVVIGCFILCFYYREWRVTHVAINHKDETLFQKGLPFASVAWLLYAVLVGARVSLMFKWDVHKDEEISNLKMNICITAITCIFFTVGHHHNHESLARRAAILLLVKTFTLDLLDTIDVLDVLFETAVKHEAEFPVVLEDIVLAVLTINLMRPAFVLWSLFMDHYASKKLALAVKISKAIMELLLVNIPLLAIRVFIAFRFGDSISVFLIKNIIAIMFGLIEVYDCCFDRMQTVAISNLDAETNIGLPDEEKNIDKNGRRLSAKNEISF